MGFQEDLIIDWTGRTIIYQGVKLLVLEKFNYKQKEYLYCCDKEKIHVNDLQPVFLYKIKDDKYACVKDDEEFEELFLHVSGLIAKEQISEDLRKYGHLLKENKN